MTRDCDVVVLCEDSPTENDRRVQAIAEFLGANVESVHLRTSGWDAVPRSTCLFVAADTLANPVDATGTVPRDLPARLNEAADHVVVYGFRATDSHATVLRVLSSNQLTGIQPLRDGTTFSVAEGYRDFCGAVSGLSLGRVNASRDHGFACVNGPSPLETMIRAGGTPFLASIALGSGRAYFVGASELADLAEPVQRGSDVLEWFSRLAPVMMVLRGTLGERVWRNPSPRACFIIDDPLLTKRYGFLDATGSSTPCVRSGSFLHCLHPWNYDRSSKEVPAQLSSQYVGPFLCVHGCDHTRGEFATTDPRTLESKSRLALERMQQQARLNGIPFDDVMVFPQGLFSSEAIAALKACGYLAAVNSDVSPSTSSSHSLCLRDLLEVAVTKFGDFPLFGRRYPRDAAAFGFDLFLGKPVLAVEHHGYFRDGYAKLASFVERLNALEPRLEWASLGSVCSRACLTRKTTDGRTHVRFFTNRFRGGTTAPTAIVCAHEPAHVDRPAPVVTVSDRNAVGGDRWPTFRSLEAGRPRVFRLDCGGNAAPPQPVDAAMRQKSASAT